MAGRNASSGDSRERGFTLLEILVVVFLLGLMFSTATVNLGRFLPASRSDQTARTLISQMELARTNAIAFGRSYRLEIDLDEESFRIVTPFDEDGKFALTEEERTDLGWTLLEQGMEFQAIEDATGWETEKGIFKVEYDASGSTRDMSVFLLNTFGTGFDRTIRVSGLTGSASVFEGRVPLPQVDEDDL